MAAFICPKCKNEFRLPVCSVCGYEIPKTDGIWQLTDDPYIVTGGDGDKYIGYENIGESYMCRKSWKLKDTDYRLPKIISEITGNGTLLDLGCGDGSFTVPCASFGTSIIAGDISQKMLTLLQKLSAENGIPLDNVTLARMNALNIPLPDSSVDTVLANSMLHVISAPEKVVGEIYRVLKPGGEFICLDDAPGKERKNEYDNRRVDEIFIYFHKRYWDILRAKGVYPKHYSWKFDRDGCCMKLFGGRSEIFDEYKTLYTETMLNEYSFPRTKGRGWSDQADVPEDIHNPAYNQALEDTYAKYGDEVNTAKYKSGAEMCRTVITLYIK